MTVLCLYNARTMPVQCPYNASTMQVQCRFVMPKYNASAKPSKPSHGEHGDVGVAAPATQIALGWGNTSMIESGRAVAHARASALAFPSAAMQYVQKRKYNARTLTVLCEYDARCVSTMPLRNDPVMTA